jgi:galactokinase
MTQITHPEQHVRRAFADRFGGTPRLFRAPGRINLIGEHTDYSDGFVFPAAIDRDCVAAIAPNGKDTLRVLSLNRDEEVELPAAFERRRDWPDYVAGVRAVLAAKGVETPGCDLIIASSVPEGAGLSSSAALEVSVMTALLAMAGRTAASRDIALWAQSAERDYADVPCGIMDQYVSVHARKGCALLLDCRSLDALQTPLPETTALLVIDSKVRHRLNDGKFKRVHDDIVEAARELGVPMLRDADMKMLEASGLRGTVRSRARHVIEENGRALAARDALLAGDLGRLGQLFEASHAGLRNDLINTCEETDALAAIARSVAGVHGARQMGGGWGGAVLAVADIDQADAAGARICELYRQTTGLETSAFRCVASDGASEIRS